MPRTIFSIGQCREISSTKNRDRERGASEANKGLLPGYTPRVCARSYLELPGLHAKRSAARPGQAEIAESNHQEVKDEYWIPRGDGVSAGGYYGHERCEIEHGENGHDVIKQGRKTAREGHEFMVGIHDCETIIVVCSSSVISGN